MFEFSPATQLEGHGRTGMLTTPHGEIHTPVFMPVGTVASVKSLSPEDVLGLKAQIILANNYHLFLRPGPQDMKTLGGLHEFMRWPKPILTDSGGFQVQSLKPKITEEGAKFRSHLDGSWQFLSPETATKSQMDLGADIIMAFDESSPADASYKLAEIQMHRTHRWLDRCIATWQQDDFATNLSAGGSRQRPGRRAQISQNQSEPEQALFGIIQGGDYPDLRKQSAQYVISKNLPGIAIGGATIGADPVQTAENISMVRELLPKNLPLYAMGVGVYPSHAIAVIKAGADMFDCVAPTRLARCGQLYHPEPKSEYLNINRSMFRLDKSVINPDCDCYTCVSGFTRAYLHHLSKSKELLFYRLASIHNLRTMIRTVEQFAASV